MPAAWGPDTPSCYTTDRETVLREAVWIRAGVLRVIFPPSGPPHQAILAAAVLIESGAEDGTHSVGDWSIELVGERVLLRY